jgi:hypothetical protein
MSVNELKTLMDDPSLRAGVDFLVVDVRRTDLDVSWGDVSLRRGRESSAVEHMSVCA